MKSPMGVQPRPQDRKEKCGLTLCMAESQWRSQWLKISKFYFSTKSNQIDIVWDAGPENCHNFAI